MINYKTPKAIVTTTINPPTKAIMKFIDIAEKDGWRLIIVGDKKTPHKKYTDLAEKYESITYLTPMNQIEISKKLSDLIGWNCIQRRNFGFIEAYRGGAEVIATIDDDNIPYPHWGKNVRVGEEYAVSTYQPYWTDTPVFDPLSVFFPNMWHRGFPVQYMKLRKLLKPQQKRRKVLVQADLWDGDPDIDAICRITLSPDVTFRPTIIPFAGSRPGPFNSQNTFLHRSVFPDYFLFPHIGRMDDIWSSYLVQALHPDCVAYAKASVKQERNDHDLVRDMENEMIGYRHTADFIAWVNSPDGVETPEYMPQRANAAYWEYQKIITEIY